MQNNITLNLETKYQTEKKEQEIALLTSQNELVEQQKKNQRNLLLGGIGLTSLGGIFLFFLYRNRQKTNKKLREIDLVKSNFFANISHEFRTPLTLISAPIEKKLESASLTKVDRANFEMMYRNSGLLLNLVDQLLDLSKLESGSLQLHVNKGDLTSLLKSIGASFNYVANKKNIDYSVHIEEFNETWFDKNVIEKITMNLLSNAFKYSPNEGKVVFNAVLKNKRLELVVQNNGSILSIDNLDKVFDRFYQVDDNSEGAGIGLALVKELVTLSYGTITVKNIGNATILFRVKLPITKNEFKNNDLAPGQNVERTFHQFSEPLQQTSNETTIEDADSDHPILLIVEDNQDIRTFVENSFADRFKVLQAENGKLGVEKAIEHVPDLIISDVMMPKKDGLELCHQLKKDERTCHIPIILLTAKAGEEDQYKGLETGADDYVSKPFKIRLLETRVENLINSRKILRDRYSQEVILKPRDIAITNLDELFLEKVQAVLDKKLNEPAFNVEAFSKAVGMSRMQLHRKLKALTGLSATEFVRSQRLKLAASLLQKSDANISEIGYTVGFNDHAYFSKCFKEAYGCSPSEYSKK
nr:response regulator [Flavobacteriaceae bacterium]